MDWEPQPAQITPDVSVVIAAADHIGVPRLPARDGFTTFECENCTCVREAD